MNKSDEKFFEKLGLDEIEDFRPEDPKMKRVHRSRWWWYNFFARATRRYTNFWGNESNTHGVKNHICSYNVKISGAFLRVFGKYNCPVDDRMGRKGTVGANQRVYKINKYNKYGVNKRLSVFNTKQ